MRKLDIQYRQSETKKKVIHKLFWQIVLYHDSYIGRYFSVCNLQLSPTYMECIFEEKMEIVQEMVDRR